jgi:hypothetical protein
MDIFVNLPDLTPTFMRRIITGFGLLFVQMPLLHKVTIALFTVFVVVWSFLALNPEPLANARAHSPEAKAFVSGALKDFCGGLYTDGVCPATEIAERQRWTASTYLGRSDIPTQQTDSILASQGWQKLSSENDKMAMFCKQGYSARYDQKEGHVGTLSFAGGSHHCEKLARNHRS